MEINKELVLSTCHIPSAVATQLEHRIITELVVIYDDFGWRILVDTEEDLFVEPNGLSSVPPVLLYLMGLARGLGCKWLVLDQDGAKEESLTQYDW